jgi:hypothetical protein
LSRDEAGLFYITDEGAKIAGFNLKEYRPLPILSNGDRIISLPKQAAPDNEAAN